MNVLFVSPLPPPMGGIATLTQKLLKDLSVYGVNAKCVNVAHMVDGRNKITNYSKIEPIIILHNSLKQVKKACKQHCVDIIHINSSGGGGTIRDYLIEKIANRYDIPVIIQYHCNLEHAVLGSYIAKKYHKRCFALAAHIVVLNKMSQAFVLKSGYQSLIIPNGITKEEVIFRKKINEKIKRVAFMGRVSRRKGCLEICECAKANPGIIFDLAGLIDEKIEQQLRSISNVNLLGPLDHHEVIKLLDKADVFMFPTYSEGFSISLLEAMARGLPCITTDVGANSEMIEEFGGKIVATKDVDALNQAIRELEPKKIREEMSEWNINKVRMFYTTDVMYKSFVELYDNYMSECPQN